MSYCAVGDGTIDLKCAAEEVPSNIIAELKENFDYVDAYDDAIDLHFDGNYCEANIYDILEKIVAYAKSGSIEFCGEGGDSFWRIDLDERSNEWTEHQGVIFWSLADIGITDEETAFLKKAIEQTEGSQTLKDELITKLGIVAD